MCAVWCLASQGSNLAEMDAAVFGGGSDPYIIAITDPVALVVKEKSNVRTSTITHELNPQWTKPRDILKLSIRTDDLDGMCDNAHLFLTCWDYDMTNDDDVIGVCAFSFRELLEFFISGQTEFVFDKAIYANGCHTGQLSGRITANGLGATGITAHPASSRDAFKLRARSASTKPRLLADVELHDLGGWCCSVM